MELQEFSFPFARLSFCKVNPMSRTTRFAYVSRQMSVFIERRHCNLSILWTNLWLLLRRTAVEKNLFVTEWVRLGLRTATKCRPTTKAGSGVETNTLSKSLQLKVENLASKKLFNESFKLWLKAVPYLSPFLSGTSNLTAKTSAFYSRSWLWKSYGWVWPGN